MEPAFEVLAEASFLGFVSPQSTPELAFKQILKGQMSLGSLFSWVGNPRGNVEGRWREFDDDALYPGIVPFREPSACPQSRVTSQGWKLI